VRKGATADPGRSLTDTAGHTAGESADLAKGVVSDAAGRIERLEEHHSVFVFVLRAIQAKRAGRAAATVTGKGGEGFRQIVDGLFHQELVRLPLSTVPHWTVCRRRMSETACSIPSRLPKPEIQTSSSWRIRTAVLISVQESHPYSAR
jgi:hypothetical protein